MTIGDPNSAYIWARQALRRDDTHTARILLTDALKKQPQQPLLHFLLGVVEDASFPKTRKSPEQCRNALQKVVDSSADDLIRLINWLNFPCLKEKDLFAILKSIPQKRRSAEVFFAMAEQAGDLGSLEEATRFVEEALKLEKQPTERTRYQILQIELLLRRQQVRRATEIQETLTDLTDDQLTELARLFAIAKAFDVTDRCYDQLRQRTKVTGLELARQIELQAEIYPPGRRRWELLAEACGAIPKLKEPALRYMYQIINEAKNPEHARIINGLLAVQKNETLRNEVMLLEARLEKDEKQACDLICEVEMRQTIPPDQLLWALQKLTKGNRPADVVRIVETRIKHGEQLNTDVALILGQAYSSLGRDHDAERAGTHQFRSVVPPVPNKQRPAPAAGGGQFSVK